jgi:Transposase DDE domain group 1
MGDAQNQPLQLSFNPRLRIEFQGSRVTSDGGLLLARELDERLGFGDLIAQHITDPRGKNAQFPLADLVRQSIYRRLTGYEDVNDAERLSHDPTFRLIGSETIWERGAALTSRVHSFETELLTQDENLTGLAAINRALLARVEAMESSRRVVLDIDSTEIPVYGQQEQSAYNGHFEAICYHPLLLFNREGDCRTVKLRPGNVHSAEHWDDVLLPEIERQQKQGRDVVVRADAAFAKPEILRSPGDAGREVRHPDPLQRHPGAGGRGLIDTARRTSQSQTGGPVQELPVPSRQLDDGAAGGGEGGVALWGIVSSRGLHRDDPRDGQPRGGAVLQQARDSGTVDQGGQGSGETDPVELPPSPGKRGAVVAECDRLQSGEPLAAARAAEADRHVVANEPAATADPDGWPTRETRAVLLAPAGGRLPMSRGPTATMTDRVVWMDADK